MTDNFDSDRLNRLEDRVLKLEEMINCYEIKLENIKNLLIEQFELYSFLSEKLDDLNSFKEN